MNGIDLDPSEIIGFFGRSINYYCNAHQLTLATSLLTLFHAGDFISDSMRGGSDLTPLGIIGLGVWIDPGIIKYH